MKHTPMINETFTSEAYAGEGSMNSLITDKVEPVKIGK